MWSSSIAGKLYREPVSILMILSRCFFRAIIVDSTRRGKRFPDALSKTIPIWCAVINRAAFKKSGGQLPWSAEDLDIYTAVASVGDSERDQIRSRLDGWAGELLVRIISPYTPTFF